MRDYQTVQCLHFRKFDAANPISQLFATTPKGLRNNPYPFMHTSSNGKKRNKKFIRSWQGNMAKKIIHHVHESSTLGFVTSWECPVMNRVRNRTRRDGQNQSSSSHLHEDNAKHIGDSKCLK
ncbi:hypothetical protein CEXT_422911 [Caerostris extrusa]|uniref:Uncharacterized protein n=1 Tax=Caerostris extrusa TaxID=172846 RepID=A0AAV4QKI1_CAEEX|nr:hypothetical protein CEXT_422911 [Caerostris extrusa]